jgi:hypothetical protein
VFGSLLVEALLSVWHAFRVWSIARGPLLSDSPFCRCLWCWVLSFPCCAFPPSWSCTRILFSVHPGFRCDVVARMTHVTPFLHTSAAQTFVPNCIFQVYSLHSRMLACAAPLTLKPRSLNQTPETTVMSAAFGMGWRCSNELLLQV